MATFLGSSGRYFSQVGPVHLTTQPTSPSPSYKGTAIPKDLPVWVQDCLNRLREGDAGLLAKDSAYYECKNSIKYYEEQTGKKLYYDYTATPYSTLLGKTTPIMKTILSTRPQKTTVAMPAVLKAATSGSASKSLAEQKPEIVLPGRMITGAATNGSDISFEPPEDEVYPLVEEAKFPWLLVGGVAAAVLLVAWVLFKPSPPPRPEGE